MAAIKHPQSKKPKKPSPRRATAPRDEVADLRAKMDAAVDDYDETIRLAKLWMDAIERNPPKRKAGEKPLWQKIVERGKRIPPEELANFPADGARNLDHYLYGSPKVED